MTNINITIIEEVDLIPNMFLSIKYADESIKFVRSQLNIDEMNALKNGPKKLSDLLKLLLDTIGLGAKKISLMTVMRFMWAVKIILLSR